MEQKPGLNHRGLWWLCDGQQLNNVLLTYRYDAIVWSRDYRPKLRHSSVLVITGTTYFFYRGLDDYSPLS